MSLLEKTILGISGQNEQAREKARERLSKLTMPHWALGRLMDLSVDLAGMTGSITPAVKRKTVVVFAGDHGVTAEGVSQYPSEVTPQMVQNFLAGGAGVNAMAQVSGTRVVVVDIGVDYDFDGANGLFIKKIARGTKNMVAGPAMTRDEAMRSIEAGIEMALELADETDLFGTGDMGIGNTTPSSAIAAVLSGKEPQDVTGRGTGIDDDRLRLKTEVIKKAIEINKPDPNDAIDTLARVGGFEIGGIAGLILGSASLKKPVVIDGVVSTAGALLASRISPEATDYMIASHLGEEPGHGVMLNVLGKNALLNFNMRLGEGSGAALAMNIVDSAERILTSVATFEEASVAEADK
ncbi:Nicotinate-nucleotide--dimethylbenzimidazole phosphoribosyltransferase [hydrothermal vent metagenome]|uniref:Nicotinate-nucleotide--dimethylbenzimidazole phosphoribosyltransferase n=1 Tax=hydrothermal vent metagenome TaxID=652676 RepID=A0A3B1BSW8_9ZZZZ